jgi:hypothetical protein
MTTLPQKLFLGVNTPSFLFKVSWAPSKVYEVNADNATYYFISFRKSFCERPLFPQIFVWVRTPPVFCLRSLGLQAKSMKSMLITQHTIPSVSEKVSVNDHSSPKTFSQCEHHILFKKFSLAQRHKVKVLPSLRHYQLLLKFLFQ